MPELPSLPTVEDEDDGSETPYIGAMKPKEVKPKPPAPKPLNPVEITTEDIIPRLSTNNVADLVLLSMVR